MKKINMIKGAGGLIVSIGVGTIINNAIKCTTPSDIGKIKKLCISVGGFALAGMISDIVVRHVETSFDSTVRSFTEKVRKEKQKEEIKKDTVVTDATVKEDETE